MKYFIFLFFIFILIVFSCKDEELIPDNPMVLTGTIEDISPQGTVFAGRILANGDLPSEEKGFVWDTIASPSIEKSYSRFTGELNKGTFSKQIDFDLIPGKKYFVRAFLQQGEDIIYGNEVTFKSKGSNGPIIDSFSPKNGKRGDTLLITGDNFSNRITNNEVEIGDFVCQIIENSKDRLKVVLPKNIYETGLRNLSVEVKGIGKVIAEVQFIFDGPQVASINPSSCGCETVEMVIKGEKFHPNKSYNQVYFYEKETYPKNSHTADILRASENELVIRTPVLFTLGKYIISITSDNLSFTVPYEFEIASAIINKIEPLSANAGEEIVVTGAIPPNTAVKFGNSFYGKNIDRTDDSLRVQIPVDLRVGEYPLSIETYCENIQYPTDFTVTTEWKYHSTFPGTARTFTNSFVIGDTFYILLGTNLCTGGNHVNELWAYNTTNSNWSRKADFPGPARTFSITTTHGVKAYLGNGIDGDTGYYLSDFWEYDPQDNQWNQMIDTPGARTYSLLFSTNGNLYWGGGRRTVGYSDLYRLNFSEGTWEPLDGLPEYSGVIYYFNNKVYLIRERSFPLDIYEFDHNINRFISLQSNFNTSVEYAIQGEKETLLLGVGNKIIRLNPTTSEIVEYPGYTNIHDRNYYIGATLNNTIFIGLGSKGPENCFNDFIYLNLNE